VLEAALDRCPDGETETKVLTRTIFAAGSEEGGSGLARRSEERKRLKAILASLGEERRKRLRLATLGEVQPPEAPHLSFASPALLLVEFAGGGFDRITLRHFVERMSTALRSSETGEPLPALRAQLETSALLDTINQLSAHVTSSS
jgi:hypothetical protein